jgi:hypothetical protein
MPFLHCTRDSVIRDQASKDKTVPRTQKGRTSGKTVSKTTELEIAKQIVGTYIRLRKMSIRTLWSGQPPLK